MHKGKKITNILSIVVTFILLCTSVFLPFFHTFEKRASATLAKNSLYAFVTKQSTAVNDGKIYVDFGVSADFNGDGKLTREDAQAMESEEVLAYETAKIYLRTRDMSAIAEEGDYEAIDQVYTLSGNNMFESIAVKVNNKGLRVGNSNRQFYVEIYKVEITRLNQEYTFYQPNATKETLEMSREILSTGAEFSIATSKQLKDGNGYTISLDLNSYEHLEGQRQCVDVTSSTSFGDIKVNLANVANGWYNKIKYLSEHDMMKLGIRVSMAAYEEPNGAYTDNSYVGIQVFAGDSNGVGAPALEGVPSNNIYHNSSAVELSRWFAKFQSDERESMNISESFIGTYEGVTVQPYHNENIYIAQELSRYYDGKNYGQGDIFDPNVNNAFKDMLVINDLNAVFKGSTTVSTRLWSYLSGKKKFYSGSLFFAPINYRAHIVSAVPGKLYYDENGEAKIGLSVRFSEPVQFKHYNDQRTVAPTIISYLNGLSAAEVTFAYVSGEGTDTLFFEAPLKNAYTQEPYEMEVRHLTLKEARGFEDVYDFAPTALNDGSKWGQSQMINVMSGKYINGWEENIRNREFVCSYDLRTPILDVNKISETVKTSHSITVRPSNISETGKLYYGWTTEPNVVPETLFEQAISPQGYQTISTPAGATGTLYLYAVAVSELGNRSEIIEWKPVHLDNEKPEITVGLGEQSTYQEKYFNIQIDNSKTDGFDKFVSLKEEVSVIISSDANGENVITTLFIDIPQEDQTKKTLTLAPFKLTAQDVGVTEYGTYYVSFAVSDVLENRYVTTPSAYYFDLRQIFNVSLVKDASSDFEMDEFMTGALSISKDYYTLDLSKRVTGQDFYFTFETKETGITTMDVDEFKNVNGTDAKSFIECSSTDCTIRVTLKSEFNKAGLYRLIFKDTTTSETQKKTLPIYFYITQGRDADNGLYQEETAGYQSISNHAAFTNKVFQIPTDIQFHYMTEAGLKSKKSYSKSSAPASFSSLDSAFSYILFREYSDLCAVPLDQTFANSLNNGIYRKAVNIRAQEGQVWIRYKEKNWNFNGTTNEWVYYFYSESRVTSININALSVELTDALDTVAGMICSSVKQVDLVTNQYLDEYGSPILSPEQMHLHKEELPYSICNTKFQTPVVYEGDLDMYDSLVLGTPLSTNIPVPFAENRHLYYKAGNSAYQPLTQGGFTTYGEYFNTTGIITILELDANGAREYSIYVDRTAPKLSVSWGEKENLVTDTFTAENGGQTISKNNFRIQGIEDSDTLAFVAIYRYASQGEGALLNVYRSSDFQNGKSVSLTDGKYHVFISDRSGNSYTFVLQVKNEELFCEVNEVENSFIRIEINRNESEVRYEVYLDGWLLTTDYSEKKFTEGGEYLFVIEDIYGNVERKSYEFKREIPTVTWSYQTADGNYAVYDTDNEQIVVQKIDDYNYLISTSTHLRFLLSDGRAYEIISGSPNPSKNVTTGWVKLNNKTAFTMKVYYETQPEIYVTYTCTVDDSAPQISVSYKKEYYQTNELDTINKMFSDGNFGLGDHGFIPQSIHFTALKESASTLYVANGERVQSKYFKVDVSDENGIKKAEVYLDGELILTQTDDFDNLYLSRRGAYQIVVTDNFGNESTFSFTNAYNERVEYFVDGVKNSTDVSFVDHFNQHEYTKVEYGNSQVEIKLLSSVEVHYILTDTQGKTHYFAFVVEDGEVYTLQYLIKVINGESNLEIENISVRSAKALAMGIVAKVDEMGVAIYLTKHNDGMHSLVVRSTDKAAKTYTVETRVSATQYEMPYYFKTMISTIPPSLEFVDGENNPIQTAQTIKVSEAFTICEPQDAYIQSVQVAYSQSGEYTEYETISDYSVVFSKEGAYHVKVLNKYGLQTDYYIIISSQFSMSATVEYIDGTTVHYSMDYTKECNDYYSNKSVEFIVYSSNVTVLDKDEAVSMIPTDQGHTIIYVDAPGSHHVKLMDEYGNYLEMNVVIEADTLTIQDNVLTGFNEDALRRDENYTNQKIFIDKAKVDQGNIVFISMTYGEKTITIYDKISEVKTEFDSNQCVGLYGDGEYTLVFRDRYGNQAETVVHYRETPTLTIKRTTLNGIGAEEYPLEEVLKNKEVWTNHSVQFIISATEYELLVDGMKNVSAISYATRTKDAYEVSYKDEYGFQCTFTVYLMREDVVIAPSENMKVTLISDLFVTKDGVQMSFTDEAVCSYTLNNEPERIYNGEVLYRDGVYRFKAVDKAGNVATHVIKKDSAAEYRLEGAGAGEVLINGGVTNGSSVKFFSEKSDNAYIKKVFHNNQFIEYNEEIFTERGKWELIIADEVGNESYFKFYILYGKMDGFVYNAPYTYEIISVKWEVEGSSIDAPETIKESGLRLEATENGKYSVTMRSSVTGDKKSFTFTIDKTPPNVELVGCAQNEKTINPVTLSGCKAGDTIYIYQDNKLVKTVRIESDYIDPPIISEAGKYRIVIENEAGVKTELAFEKKYVPNQAGSILIIILSLVGVAGFFIGLVWRNHSKTDE